MNHLKRIWWNYKGIVNSEITINCMESISDINRRKMEHTGTLIFKLLRVGKCWHNFVRKSAILLQALDNPHKPCWHSLNLRALTSEFMRFDLISTSTQGDGNCGREMLIHSTSSKTELLLWVRISRAGILKRNVQACCVPKWTQKHNNMSSEFDPGIHQSSSSSHGATTFREPCGTSIFKLLRCSSCGEVIEAWTSYCCWGTSRLLRTLLTLGEREAEWTRSSSFLRKLIGESLGRREPFQWAYSHQLLTSWRQV